MRLDGPFLRGSGLCSSVTRQHPREPRLTPSSSPPRPAAPGPPRHFSVCPRTARRNTARRLQQRGGVRGRSAPSGGGQQPQAGLTLIEKLAGERPDPSQVLLLGEAVFLLLQEVSANDLRGRGRGSERGKGQSPRSAADSPTPPSEPEAAPRAGPPHGEACAHAGCGHFFSLFVDFFSF